MKQVNIHSNLLKVNEMGAAGLKREFDDRGIFVVNLLGSPGCGKTSILENTIPVLKKELNVAVIEGDIYTTKDARRIEKQGVPVVQINTGGACHLDSSMIRTVLADLPPDNIDLLIIENVGNLVCPAAYNLGEDVKMVVLSTTEGDDKPSKYPAIFQRAGIVLINKVDLLEQTNFSLDTALKDIRVLNPGLEVFELSCTTGRGVKKIADYLIKKVHQKRIRG